MALLVSYRLASESLERLSVESVAIREENGVRFMEFVLGTMKNLTGSLSKVDAALFKQRVVECPDVRFCAVDAYNKLCDMLPTKTGPLFRSMQYTCQKKWAKRQWDMACPEVWQSGLAKY